MRIHQPVSGRLRAPLAAAANPSRQNPTYMYGTFRSGRSGRALACPGDDAMLGIRNDPSAWEFEIHPHRHADVRTRDSHAFMFGVDQEQSPVAAPAEPAFYFWDVR